jgi:glycosyltransferase involved in cell wall biosynthesis
MTTVLFPVNELKVGGAEQQLLELVRGLDKRRFRPIVAPLYSGGPLEAEFRAIPGVEVVELGRRGKYDFTTLWTLATLLRRRRVDIVQPFLSPATFFGLLPALVSGTPVKIVTERCGVRRVRGFGYRAYRAAEDALTRFADAVIPNSAAGQDDLLRRGIPRSKITVIYNGISIDRLQVDSARSAAIRERLAVPPDGHVAGILASLTPAKGHETLLRAAASLATAFPGLRYAIIGDGPLRPRLEQLTHELGLGERVVFFGNQRNVGDYLAACDVLVSASRDNEGCSNSILEAMALRIPVIATDVGGSGELVRDGDTGTVIPPDSPAALAAALRRVLSAPAQAKAMVERAHKQVEERFALQRMVRDYEALYQRLL